MVSRFNKVWNDRKLSRMLQWCLVSLALYGIALAYTWPLLIQAALTKMANVNAGAFIGYWIDRTLFKGFDAGFHDKPEEYSNEAKAARLIARGLIVGACILGLSTGVGA